jgi:hypothetical protein
MTAKPLTTMETTPAPAPIRSQRAVVRRTPKALHERRRSSAAAVNPAMGATTDSAARARP